MKNKPVGPFDKFDTGGPAPLPRRALLKGAAALACGAKKKEVGKQKTKKLHIKKIELKINLNKEEAFT